MTPETSTTPTPPAVVMGGNEPGLSIAWSLGRRGIPVYALGCSKHMGRSRYVRSVTPEELGGASRARDPQAWVEWLLGKGREVVPGGILLPCNDEALEAIFRNRAALAKHYVMWEAKEEAVFGMLDKLHTYEIAQRAGVPAPRIWPVDTRRQAEALLGELSYPCALKPREAHLFDKSFENQKLFVVGSEAELLEKLDTLEKLGLKMMVTEIIPGREDRFVSYWTFLDAEGRPLYEFTKRKYRQFPVHFGLGTLHASERVPGVGELGLRFLRTIGLCGPAVIEFKQDPRDGAFKLIECNARFTKAADVIVRAGIDMPLLVYNHLARRPLPAVDGYREGVRLWFPLEDLKALRALRRNGELTLDDWLPTLLPPWNVALFNWRDPWPAVAYTLSRVFGKVFG